MTWPGFRILAALALACTSACSAGGHGQTTAPALHEASASQTGTTTLTFTIPLRVPAATVHRKKPAYISPGSEILSVTATNTQNDTITTPAIALSSYCQTETSGRVCSVPVPAPIGTDTLTVKLEDSYSNVLSVATGVTVTVIEGSASIANAIVLNPVPTGLTVSFPGATPDSTAAVPVTLSFTDADADTISGEGSFENAAGTPLTLVLTPQTTSTGSFSTSASCGTTATSFPGWTLTSTLYFCPNGNATLGSLYDVTLGSASASFSARRTGQSTSGALAAYSTTAVAAQGTVISVAGSDAAGSPVAIGTSPNTLEVGSYSTSAVWSGCYNYDGAPFPAIALSQNGAYLLGAEAGFATLLQYTTTGGCAQTSATAPTNSDVTAITPDPRVGSTTLYAVNSNNSSTNGLRSIDSVTLNQAGGGVPNCGSSGSSFPHSVAVGPGDVLYVGCNNTTGIDSQPLASFGQTHTTIPITPASGTYTASYVAANIDIAFAITVGTSPVLIYQVSGGNPQLVYTFASASDSYVPGSATVANDDRLYLALENTTTSTYRIVAFDPHTGTLTDPAVAISSLLNTSDPMFTALGRSGTLVIAGTLATGESGYPGFVYWPN